MDNSVNPNNPLQTPSDDATVGSAPATTDPLVSSKSAPTQDFSQNTVSNTNDGSANQTGSQSNPQPSGFYTDNSSHMTASNNMPVEPIVEEPNQSNENTPPEKKSGAMKKVIVGALVLLLLVVGGASAYTLLNTDQDVRKQAEGEPTPTATPVPGPVTLSCSGFKIETKTVNAEGQTTWNEAQKSNGVYQVPDNTQLRFTPQGTPPTGWSYGMRFTHLKSSLGSTLEESSQGSSLNASVWCGQLFKPFLADDYCDEAVSIYSANSDRRIYFKTNLSAKIGNDFYWCQVVSDKDSDIRWVKATNGDLNQLVYGDAASPGPNYSCDPRACQGEAVITNNSNQANCYSMANGCTAPTACSGEMELFTNQDSCVKQYNLAVCRVNGDVNKVVTAYMDSNEDSYTLNASGTGGVYNVKTQIFRSDPSIAAVSFVGQKYYCANPDTNGECRDDKVTGPNNTSGDADQEQSVSFSPSNNSLTTDLSRNIPQACGAMETILYFTKINGVDCDRPQLNQEGNNVGMVCNNATNGADQRCASSTVPWAASCSNVAYACTRLNLSPPNPQIGQAAKITCVGTPDAKYEIKVKAPGASAPTLLTAISGSPNQANYTFATKGSHDISCTVMTKVN